MFLVSGNIIRLAAVHSLVSRLQAPSAPDDTLGLCQRGETPTFLAHKPLPIPQLHQAPVLHHVDDVRLAVVDSRWVITSIVIRP